MDLRDTTTTAEIYRAAGSECQSRFLRPRLTEMTKADEPVWFDYEQATAADFVDPVQSPAWLILAAPKRAASLTKGLLRSPGMNRLKLIPKSHPATA